jgi:hypothetical protein
VGRAVEGPAECTADLLTVPMPVSGQVRLRVGDSGEAALVGVAEGTGNACFDRLLAMVADALQYEWLPDVRFPAPVELVQPVQLLDVAEVL